MAGENEQAGAEGAALEAGAEATAASGAIDFGKLTVDQARALAAQFYHEKSKANDEAAKHRSKNKETADAMKQLQSDAAELKKIRDAQKTAEQKAIEEVTATKAELAVERTALAHAKDMVHVVSAGVLEPYAEFVAGQLARSRAADPDLDVKAFMADQKKQSPAFFVAAGQKPGAAGGGQVPGDQKTQLKQEVTTIETQIAAEQKLGNTRRVFGLMQQRAAKLEELGPG